MKEENYWDAFMASGRIEDYLAYATNKGSNYIVESTHFERDVSGEKKDAGFLYGNGDGDKPDSYR